LPCWRHRWPLGPRFGDDEKQHGLIFLARECEA
jgi:hypothetical protein